VDGQSIHFETECHSSKLSQPSVYWLDALFGSKCHVVGSWVDGSSRHHITVKTPTLILLTLSYFWFIICLHKFDFYLMYLTEILCTWQKSYVYDNNLMNLTWIRKICFEYVPRCLITDLIYFCVVWYPEQFCSARSDTPRNYVPRDIRPC
jgi:hypothetical protein